MLMAAALGLLVSELWCRFGLTRRACKEVMLLMVRLDLAAVALVRRLVPPRYELLGACQRRGACCTQIVAHVPRRLAASPRLLRIYIAMHRIVHNFHVVGRGPNEEVIFRCHFLTDGGRCGIYRYRPRLCRTYPLLPFFKAPSILPGCGYRVRRRGLNGSHRLPIVSPHVAVHHPTPPTRRNDTALEHEEDFRLVEQ